MRKDIGKVITERPRTHSGDKAERKGYKKRLQREGLDVVKRESMKARGNNDKNFTDVLSPLVGFLRKNCGRPWDKVCSEMNAVLPATGGVSYSHARDHFFQFVTTDVQIIDGEYYDSKGYPLGAWYRHGDFFVNEHGILKELKAKRKSYRYKPPRYDFAKTDKGEWLFFDKKVGVWFACEMAPYESCGTKPHPRAEEDKMFRSWTTPVYPHVYDAWFKRTCYCPFTLKQSYGSNVYCVRKRQINKKEIKRYELTPASEMLAA